LTHINAAPLRTPIMRHGGEGTHAMSKFVYCDWSDIVWQIDESAPATPVTVHSGSGNVESLALAADKQLQMIAGPSGVEIRKTQGAHGYVSIYVDPQAYQVFLAKVRTRLVGFGQERIYFSSYDTAQGAQYIGEQIFQIRYLQNGVAVPYVTIYPSQLTIPDPCHPSEEMAAYLNGDFAFGDNDKLYLATGNFSGENGILVRCGVYEVDGAGADAVTGTVKRIYLAEGPISGLSYRSPNTLYFVRNYDICRLDLSATPPTETLVCTIPPSPIMPGVLDLAYVGDGLSWSQSWSVSGVLHNWLKAVAVWVWKVGLLVTTGKWPKKPGPKPPWIARDRLPR
jgi:hypothetical protein